MKGPYDAWFTQITEGLVQAGFTQYFKIVLFVLVKSKISKHFNKMCSVCLDMKTVYLYLNLEPILKKFCLPVWPLTGPLSLKKAWCSTAHFHKCLHAFSLVNLNTNKCSCWWPWKIDKIWSKTVRNCLILQSSLHVVLFVGFLIPQHSCMDICGTCLNTFYPFHMW